MTSSPLVIAVDSSTTSTKAVVVDEQGTVLASGQRAIALHTPGIDRYEHDPRNWWTSTDEAVRAAVTHLSPDDRRRVRALAVTPQRQSFALLDGDGEPLRPAILWLDSRASAEVAELGSRRVHELSGFPPDVTPSLYKLGWLRRHEPAHLDAAAHVAGVHGYLVHALTGDWLDSQACADSFGLFDMTQLDFSAELLDLVGVRREQLPTLAPPGDALGRVQAEVLDAWGLPGPVDVVAGCGDGQAAALGAGALGPDEAYLNMGTALVAGVHSATYRHAEVFRTDAAGLPGQYVLEIVQNSGAHLADWFRAELGDPALAGRPDPGLDAAAAAVAPGCGGLLTLPYWNAVQSPHWDPLARGAIVGLAGTHGRPELYRSLLEGLSLEMARNFRGLQAATGVALRRIAIMGGGQRSPLWRQLMTDCIGVPLTACRPAEVSAQGAAVLALAWALHEDVATTARALASDGEVSEPDADAHAVYRELDVVHSRLYGALADVFAAQQAFAARHPLGEVSAE